MQFTLKPFSNRLVVFNAISIDSKRLEFLFLIHEGWWLALENNGCRQVGTRDLTYSAGLPSRNLILDFQFQTFGPNLHRTQTGR